MDEAHVRVMIYLVWNDKLARTTIFSVLVLSLILTLTLSFLSGLLVFGSYLLGFFIFAAIFSHVSELPNLLFFLNGNHGRLSKKLQSRCCTVCGNSKCSRHQPSFQQPWLGLDIPEEVDEALEKFFKKALDEFIYNWYSEMSNDENFIQELKQSIRYATSVLLRNILQVDFPRLIMCKLIPAGIQHLDDFLGIKQWAKSSGVSIDAASLQYIGTRMHPAAFNRETELAYLRQLTNLLLPHLMPNHHLNCNNYRVLVREVLAGWILLPAMDTIADPSVINSLLLLLLDRQPLTNYPKQPHASVPFLAHFAMPTVCPAHFSALRLDMAGVLKDQSLLYPFMQFLKGEGSVNILQFCLDVEEFNRKMITPDLSEQDFENLYREAWDLYSVYFNPASPDHISFSASVVEEMHSILQEHPGNIVKLRTTPPLFQAYEFAFSQLENILGPLFHQSDDYFVLLCGQRLSNSYAKSGSRLNKKWNESGAVAKLSSRLHKIKGALRAQPVEGHTFDNETALDLGETEFAEDLHLSESSTNRDLSAWRVSISSVESQIDINNKPYPVYRISVQRIDVKSDDDPSLCHWSVDRKYNDFYLLESKLTEFHGEFSDLHLPPKRILFGPRSVEFMESKRHVFEEFLQKLLQKPNLRGSDLLHTFLQSPSEFVPASVGVPEGLGRMIRRSVPIRLRKERGQHLDTFLTTYMTSTEMGKSRSSKYEWKDISAATTCKTRSLTQTVFRDNFGVLFNQPSFVHMGVGAGGSALRIQGIFDCILYLAVRVFGASKSFLQLGLTLQSMFHNILTVVSCKYLNFKLKQLLVPQRIAHLIKLLQGAVFGPKSKTLSSKELELRAEKTLKELQGLLPGILSPWLGKKYGNGVSTLFSCLQNPLLNKQLSYYLLDIVAVELFPDVVTGELSP